MNVEEEYLTLDRTFVLSNGYSLAVFHFSVCTRCSLNQSIKGPCHLISWVSATFPCFSSRLRSVWRESEFDLEWVGILTTLRTEPLFQVDDRKNNMKYFYSFRKSETTLKHENELESLTPIHSTLLERYQESNCYFFFFFDTAARQPEMVLAEANVMAFGSLWSYISEEVCYTFLLCTKR